MAIVYGVVGSYIENQNDYIVADYYDDTTITVQSQVTDAGTDRDLADAEITLECQISALASVTKSGTSQIQIAQDQTKVEKLRY